MAGNLRMKSTTHLDSLVSARRCPDPGAEEGARSRRDFRSVAPRREREGSGHPHLRSKVRCRCEGRLLPNGNRRRENLTAPVNDGASRGTRTLTALRPQGPQPCASTNSATDAFGRPCLMTPAKQCQPSGGISLKARAYSSMVPGEPAGSTGAAASESPPASVSGASSSGARVPGAASSVAGGSTASSRLAL